MTQLQMRLFGDPILTSPSLEVTSFDAELHKLADDMFETMYAAPGVGLAAPQIGVAKRFFVYDSGEQKGALANPEIVFSSDETQEVDEGCLSLPGLYFPVIRALRVRVSGHEPNGERVEIEAAELLARIFQHETDHTNGILFIDRLTPELRKEAMRALRDADLGLLSSKAPTKTSAL